MFIIAAQGLGNIAVEGQVIAELIGAAHGQITPGAIKIEFSGLAIISIGEMSIHAASKFMIQAQASKVSAMLTSLAGLKAQGTHDAGEGILRNMTCQGAGAIKITATQSANGQRVQSNQLLRCQNACYIDRIR